MLRIFSIAGSLVLVLVLVGVASLTYGVEVREKVLDREGDLDVRDGYRPGERRLADITTASVKERGPDMVFEATLSATVPGTLPGGTFSIVWDVAGEETDWAIEVIVGESLDAIILSKDQGAGHSLGTENFHGTVELDGRNVIFVLDTSKLDNFPDRFRWFVETELDVSPGQPGAGIVTDRAPDGRYGNYRL